MSEACKLSSSSSLKLQRVVARLTILIALLTPLRFDCEPALAYPLFHNSFPSIHILPIFQKETWTFYAVIYLWRGKLGRARVKLFQFHSVIGLDHNDKVVTFSGRNCFAYVSVRLYHKHTHTHSCHTCVHWRVNFAPASCHTRHGWGVQWGATIDLVQPPELDQFPRSHLSNIGQLWSVKNFASCSTCLKFVKRVWQMFSSQETNETYSRSMTFN